MSKLHRFYVPDTKLTSDFWFKDEKLLHQWCNVLRFKIGQNVVLFDGKNTDRLYEIVELADKEAHMLMITELTQKLPKVDIYLMWSMLKNDKNEWVVQKCTELGVSHFIPIVSERCERANVSDSKTERWQKIAIEASEQCGRSDIPSVRHPVHLKKAIEELQDKISLVYCEQSDDQDFDISNIEPNTSVGLLIGPEGGWSDAEKSMFEDSKISHLNLHDFTLRAETAAITAVSKLLQ